MPWVKLPPPDVPSLETADPSSAKRFTSIKINELLTLRSDWIKSQMEKLGINTPQKAIEFVITKIDYPFYLGMPDDKHSWNAFHGKACYTINLDYWQSSYETLMTYILNNKLKGKHGYGDCEDSSILAVALLRLLNVESYEILGMVYQNSKLLGGHGYLIAKLDDGKWHLIESTLDVPPKYPDGYPIIDPDSNTYKCGNLTYVGMIKFNESEYYEWHDTDKNKSIQGISTWEVKRMRIDEYLKMNKKHKHKKSKHKKIKEEWSRNS